MRIFSFASNRNDCQGIATRKPLSSVHLLWTHLGHTCLLYHQSFSAVGFANAFYFCSEEPPKLWVRLLIANTLRGEDVSSNTSTV